MLALIDADQGAELEADEAQRRNARVGERRHRPLDDDPLDLETVELQEGCERVPIPEVQMHRRDGGRATDGPRDVRALVGDRPGEETARSQESGCLLEEAPRLWQMLEHFPGRDR